MNNFKELAKELKKERDLKEIEASYGIPLLDFALVIAVSLLAIDLGLLFVSVIR